MPKSNLYANERRLVLTRARLAKNTVEIYSSTYFLDLLVQSFRETQASRASCT